MNDKEKMTFLQWIDNVWYHYKTPIIIGVFALVLAAVGFSQCAMRQKADVFIYVVGRQGLPAQAADELMQEMADSFAVDANDDGKTVVDLKFDTFNMVQGENGQWRVYNPEKQMSETGRFQLELGNGECVIYIMDVGFFEGNLDYFASFEETLGYVPENAIEGKGIRLGDLSAYKATMTLVNIPEDYIICLADKENRIDEDYYNGNVKFLDNLIKCKFNSK